jgi:hypothetical protein
MADQSIKQALDDSSFLQLSMDCRQSIIEDEELHNGSFDEGCIVIINALQRVFYASIGLPYDDYNTEDSTTADSS